MYSFGIAKDNYINYFCIDNRDICIIFAACTQPLPYSKIYFTAQLF